MAIPSGFLEEIKNRVAVSEVVSKRVKLTKKGREHSGLCPFHNEKSPSFTVNDDKGFYHCFGCGAHGSVIDFVINTEGLNFPEAIERLAGLAGLEVPDDTPQQRERAEKRKTLYDVMEAAAQFYEKMLKMPEGQEAAQYLHHRGLTAETQARFRLGYAPQGGLQAALKREGISDALMIEAGLLIQPDDRNRSPYDRFRQRVMFPITDRRGKVIAFGGRLLGEGKPKYLNSPDTPLFHKGTILYGLAQAREASYKAGEILVTEGYMDVIALAQGGFPNAVAPLGTALTEEQIQLLWKMSPSPILCFDGDAAGQRAAARGAERALPHLKAGYGLRFVHLPQGEDPDSLIKAQGSAAMQEVLDQAIPLSELLWRLESEGKDLSLPEDRAVIEDRLKYHGFQIEDESVKGHFLSALKSRLWDEIKKQKQPQSTYRPKFQKWDKSLHHTHLPAKSGAKTRINAQEWRETLLIAAIIFHPVLIQDVGERLGHLTFQSESLDKLRQDVLKTLDGDSFLEARALQDFLRQKGHRDIIDRLLTHFQPSVQGRNGHVGFLNPDQPIDIVLRGWTHTFLLYVKDRDLNAELEDLKRQMKQEPTPQLWAQFQAHMILMGMIDIDADTVPDQVFIPDEQDLFD